MSAFWAAGREGARFQEKRLHSKRQNAKVDRIGRMVNVYKKESRHRMNPKPTIWLSLSASANQKGVLGHLFNGERNVEKITNSFPLHFLMRIKVGCE